jgi:hypothetical protein
MPVVSAAPGAPVLSVTVSPGALSVPPVALVSAEALSPAPNRTVSVASTRPGLALVSTPPAPVYPAVSGRATPAEDESWAARRGAKAPMASAAASAVR